MTVSGRGRGRVTTPGPPTHRCKNKGTYLLGAYVLTRETSYLLVMN